MTVLSARGLKKALKIAFIWPSLDVPSIHTYGLATGFKYLLVGVLLSFNFVRCILNQIIQISTPQNYLSQSCDDSLLEQLPIWIKILKRNFQNVLTVPFVIFRTIRRPTQSNDTNISLNFLWHRKFHRVCSFKITDAM